MGKVVNLRQRRRNLARAQSQAVAVYLRARANRLLTASADRALAAPEGLFTARRASDES